LINLYKHSEIKILRQGGKILAMIMERLIQEVKVGRSEIEIDNLARRLAKENQAEPAFLGYLGFPAALCVSVNEELVHGIPTNRKFQVGDIVSLDFGIRYKGLCLDKAVTFPLIKCSLEQKNFLKTVQRALELATDKVKDGEKLGKISFTIQKTIESKGYKVIKELCGHGIGKNIHEEPSIPNFGREKDGPVLKERMVLAIEPMASMGNGKIRFKKDKTTIISADNSLTAHFEDTVVVTKNGALNLTTV